jgi:hypothetical protein
MITYRDVFTVNGILSKWASWASKYFAYVLGFPFVALLLASVLVGVFQKLEPGETREQRDGAIRSLLAVALVVFLVSVANLLMSRL